MRANNNSGARTLTHDDRRKLLTHFFDEALNAGKGFYDFGDGLRSGHERYQNDVDLLAGALPDGEARKVFRQWEAERGDQLTRPVYMVNGADVLTQVLSDLADGKAEKLFNCGEALRGIEIGPGLLTLIGAPPGRGKTALAMQSIYEAIANESDLRACIVSLEVTAETLIKRRLAMLLGVQYDAIRFNTLNAYQREQAHDLSRDFSRSLSRVGFQRPERSGLGDLDGMRSEIGTPGLLLIDYVQLLGDPNATAQDRGMQTMGTLKRFTDAGWAVVAISALNRSSYQGAELGSFRDTSNIEYTGTAAYLLDETGDYADDRDKPAIREMKLRCVKNRNGGIRHIDLLFNGPQMLFSAREAVSEHEGDFDDWNSDATNPFAGSAN